MAEILSEFGHLVGLAGGNNIQATTMPTYSSVPLGTIVQYIGTTTADYINGYFYKATATGWEQHDTQPASNADNSITAFKESSPAQAAHAVDDYIRYNNVTYIVTAAIAIGDTLTIGTNIAVPTLDEGTVIYTPEAGGGSAGGGHIIVNPSGTDMEQRASLQFVDANVTDDSSNGKTKIENVKVINSESELANVSDGMYMGSYDDEAEGVISADMIMYDSETTVEEELDNKVDKVVGKGLSTNDYDNTDKAKVGKIDETTTAVTGNPISITGLKSNQLAKDPIITLEPIQAGSGDPSPSNVRAISGYDKIEVLSARKNLLDGSPSFDGYYAVSGGTWEKQSETYNGHEVYKRTGLWNGFGKPQYVNTGIYTFSVSVKTNDSDDIHLFYYFDDPIIPYPHAISTSDHSTVSTSTNWTRVSGTFEVTTAGYLFLRVERSTEGDIYISEYQLEGGSIATPYEPYNPLTDIQLTLGQTIYGGTLDVEKGILTVDTGYVDLGSLDYTLLNVGQFYVQLNSIEIPDSNIITSGISSKFKSDKYDNWRANYLANHNYFFVVGELNYVYFHTTDQDSSSASEFKSSVVGTQLVYPLATPFTIQLTPHEISLLKDYAYVSTNGTNMSFSYHNGEIASLADVSQLGQTVNELGDAITNVIEHNNYYTIGKMVYIKYRENITFDGVNDAICIDNLPMPYGYVPGYVWLVNINSGYTTAYAAVYFDTDANHPGMYVIKANAFKDGQPIAGLYTVPLVGLSYPIK